MNVQPAGRGAVAQKPVDVAAAAGAPRAAPDAAPNGAGVELVDGALTFAPGKVPVQTQLERAKAFLEVLRTQASGTLTFGGRVGAGAADPSATLRNYYALTLKTARVLLADPDLARSVAAFIVENVSVPDDLKKLLLSAMDLAKHLAPVAEPAAPVGTRTDVTAMQAAHQLATRGAPFDKETYGLADAVIADVAAWYNGFQSQYIAAAPADGKPAILRLFARIAETGLNANFSAVQLNAVEWPVNSEMASVLLRVCAAARIDPATIVYNGATLANLGGLAAAAATTARRTPRPALAAGQLPSAPVGVAAHTGVALEGLIAARDPAVFQVNDISLELMSLSIGGFYAFAYNNFVDDPEWVKGLLTAWDRAAAINVDATLANFPTVLRDRIGGSRSFADPGVKAATARLLRRAGVNPAEVPGPTGALTGDAAFMEAWSHVDRLVFGAQAAVPTLRPAIPSPGPISNAAITHADWQAKYNANDPAFYAQTTDANIATAGYVVNGYNPTNFSKGAWIEPGSVTLCARFVELGSAATKTQCTQWLNAGVPSTFAGNAFVVPLVRLAIACGLDPKEVQYLNAAGARHALATHPAYPHPAPAAEVVAHQAELLAQLDPAAAPTADSVLATLAELLKTPAELQLERGEVLAALARALTEGRFARARGAELSADHKAKLVALLDGVDHLGVTTMLAAFVVDGSCDTALTAALRTRGYSEEQTKTWFGYAEALRALSPARAEWAVAGIVSQEPDFALLPLRIALAADAPLDPTKTGALFDAHVATDAFDVIRAFVDRAALSPAGDADRTVVAELLRARVASGAITADVLRAALADGRAAVVYEDIGKSIDDAVTAVIKAGPADAAAAKALGDELKKHTAVADIDGLVKSAMAQLYASDLAHVLPLKAADGELGGVAAKPWVDGVKKAGKALGKTVEVAGIAIQVNDDPEKDVRAVPRKASADMVMTPTTLRNLRLIAAEWRRGRPVLLEGPTSAGKTSAVRYLAHMSGSPYRRINLSYHTDVSDLLGRYVGGEHKYALTDLEKKDDKQLRALAHEYGLDETLDVVANRAEVVALLFEAQDRPRWVDGPVVKAMRRGEVLLLDEVNLARPEVLERLNSLFDDDGNIVLTEHRNEVVKKHPNFRIFSTMNPASYAGRAKLSEAMRSRWTTIFCQGLTQTDLTQILKAKYDEKVPDAELAKLIATHDALARAADDGSIGRAGGGLAFSLRNLARVCDRFVRYRGGALTDDALMRRETEEVYRGGLFDKDDLIAVDDLLKTAMPYDGPSFYGALDITETEDTFNIGDVTIRKLNTGSDLVPSASSQLVLTRRTKEILYRLAKALDAGENVALIGERASGKTAIAKMFAHIIGQPYYRQLISAATDTMQLIGGYDDRGWKDGLLLTAGRPDGVPGLLLLDELNLGGSALLERLNPVLDDERKVVLAESEGEEIRLHEDFHFVAAMNPPTKGYGGRQKLSVAMQNRLTQIYVPDLNTAEEQLEILKVIASRKGVDAPIAEALVTLHQWTVAAYHRGELGKDLRESDRPVLSIRQLTAALDMVAEFQDERGVGDAFMLAVEAYYASTANQADSDAILKKAAQVAQ